MKKVFVILLCLAMLLPGCAKNPAEAQATTLPPETTLPPVTEQPTTQPPEEVTTEPPTEAPTVAEEEIEAARAVLESFFEAHKAADYESIPGYFSQAGHKYIHDGDVWGNRTAELMKAEFFDKSTPENIYFKVHAKIDPIELSALAGETEATFFIGLVKEDGVWKINEFFNGW